MDSKSRNPTRTKPPEPAGSAAAAALSFSMETQPATMLKEIKVQLSRGRFRRAQQLAREAAGRFPRHAEINRMNRGLNEWTMSTRPSDEPDRTEEFAWLRHPPDSVHGKWVALLGHEMVASAETLVEVMRRLESLNLPAVPLVHRVD